MFTNDFVRRLSLSFPLLVRRHVSLHFIIVSFYITTNRVQLLSERERQMKSLFSLPPSLSPPPVLFLLVSTGKPFFFIFLKTNRVIRKDEYVHHTSLIFLVLCIAMVTSSYEANGTFIRRRCSDSVSRMSNGFFAFFFKRLDERYLSKRKLTTRSMCAIYFSLVRQTEEEGEKKKKKKRKNPLYH